MDNKISKINKRFNYLLGELNATYHDIALQLGISDSAMQILYMLCDYDGSCLLLDICRLSGLSKQTINSAIRNLEKNNIVELDSDHKKYKTVKLTENGKMFAENTAIKVINMETSIFSSWEKDDVDKYLELTEKYLFDVKDKSKNL